MKTRRLLPRRGSVYLVVLGLCTIVSILALGALSAGFAQRRSAEALNDAAEARSYAAAALDLGRYTVNQDPSWRTNHSSGTWLSSVGMGSGTCSLTGTDLLDGNLANRPYDPLTLIGTGYKGRAIQMMQATVNFTGTPIDALGYALCVPGQLHITSNGIFLIPNATATTNGTFRNDSYAMGNVQCSLSTGAGTISGNTTILNSAIASPPSNVESLYVGLGTPISPGAALEKCVLAPGNNPYGTTNVDGVYVINSGGDVHIRNCRINGTLVVVAPGKNVIIEQTVLIQPARPDFPALIIDGNAQFTYTTNGTSLSEASVGVNFNPAGVPYNGVSNTTLTDTYPSMISGLVHVKGTIRFDGNGGLIRGAVICESPAAGDAVKVNSYEEIDYDPTLFTSPPQGYTKSIAGTVQSGTWTRVTN